MITLNFGGYGGEYTIGTLTPNEINNIKTLLKRFHAEFFINEYELAIDDTYNKYHWFDYDDVLSYWSISDLINVSVNNELHFQINNISSVGNEILNISQSGFYLMACSHYKGGAFFTAELDIDPEQFDINLITFETLDLSKTYLNDTIVKKLFYDGVELELNHEERQVKDRGLYQRLVYIDDEGINYNGVDVLLNEIISNTANETDNDMFRIISDISYFRPVEITNTYIAIHNNPDDETSLEEIPSGSLIYFSPLIEKLYGVEKCCDLWLSDKKHFKFAKSERLLDDIPKFVLSKIKENNPEWLI